MDPNGNSRARGDFRRRRYPRLATHPGEQGEAQVVGEVERGDRDAVLLEPGVRDAGAGAGGRLVVQLGVARRGLRDGVRAAVVDDGIAAVAVPELDAVGVELVVAQLDRLAQRVPAVVPGRPGLVEGAERLP